MSQALWDAPDADDGADLDEGSENDDLSIRN